MEFSEASEVWGRVPDWASFLIRYGYDLLPRPDEHRRVLVVSMPTESAGAGLIVLGAMRKALELSGANDRCGHFRRLCDLARQKNPPVLCRINCAGRYAIEGIGLDGRLWVKKTRDRRNTRQTISSSTATDWHVEDEPPVEMVRGEGLSTESLYRDIVAFGGDVRPENCRMSHSQIYLAGRVAGKTEAKQAIANVRFRTGECEAALSQLLTIHGWANNTVSRVAFHNCRTNKSDRVVGTPQLVVADGNEAFLDILDDNRFREGDVVGVIDRTVERYKLEDLAAKLGSLRQWYDLYEPNIRACPPGMGVCALKIRT